MLPAVFRAETSAAKDENHRILSLQFGEFSALGGVIRKLVVGKNRSGNYVRSHIKTTFFSLKHDTLNVKNRENFGPTRRSHLLPCPTRNGPHRGRGLRPSARPYGSVPVRRGRRRGHTYPRSLISAVASRASKPATWGSHQ